MAALPLLVKKDRDDVESPLFILFPEFQSYIENASIDSILRLTNTLIACDKLNYIFTNKVSLRAPSLGLMLNIYRCHQLILYSFFCLPFKHTHTRTVYNILCHCAASENGKCLRYITERNNTHPTGRMVGIFNGISQCSRHTGIKSIGKCCLRK